jgi:hypothetical protein
MQPAVKKQRMAARKQQTSIIRNARPFRHPPSAIRHLTGARFKMTAYLGCGVAGGVPTGMVGKVGELLVVVGATGGSVPGCAPTGIFD